MKKRTIEIRVRALFILVMCICLLTSGFNTSLAETAGQASLDTRYFKDVSDMIKENYNGTVTDVQLTEGALKGLFDTMDPYTTFFTMKEAKSFMNSIGGSYTGIGISMDISGDYILVVKVFPGSPAEKAGILQGDRIAEVDGRSIAGQSPEQAAAVIMGEAGTKVKIGVLRAGKAQIINFDVTRDVIVMNPITYEIRNGIGYIKLETFNSNAGNFMTQALKEMDGKGVTKLVLDLRGNPGGEVSQAVDIARKFVPSGVITVLDFKSSRYQDQVYRSYLEVSRYKLVLLVNGSSASASEILAGAVQDTKSGILVGSKTFGKSKVQGLIPLLSPAAVDKYEKTTGARVVDAYQLAEKYGISAEESDLIGYSKITIGYYYTPSGRLIDEKGIDPDVVVKDPSPVNDINVNVIFKLTKTAKPTLKSEGSDVLNAERILKMLGYIVDTPDNILDEKTFTAIKKFQKDSKLHPYGALDYTTQSALNNALDGLILKYDTQYAKAVELLGK